MNPGKERAAPDRKLAIFVVDIIDCAFQCKGFLQFEQVHLPDVLHQTRDADADQPHLQWLLVQFLEDFPPHPVDLIPVINNDTAVG